MSTGPFGLYKQLQNYSFGIITNLKGIDRKHIRYQLETNTLILSKKITDEWIS